MIQESTLMDLIGAQIASQKVGCIRVSDGHVFTFTTETIKTMLERAEESGKVVVFVRTGVES